MNEPPVQAASAETTVAGRPLTQSVGAGVDVSELEAAGERVRAGYAAPRSSGRGGTGRARSAVVVGAGFGGLAAALRLRAKGYEVTLLERGERLGGRAQVFERDGFRHDAGPTVVTAPFLFEELFALFGKSLHDYVTLVPLDPWYRFWFPDGETFDYGGSVADTQREIARFSSSDAQGYLRLIEHSRKLFQTGFVDLADVPFHDPRTMLRQAPALLRLRAYDTVWDMVCRYFEHPKIRQAFSIQPLLVGGSPFDTTSIYGLIHYLERQWGVFFAMGGTGALVHALERLLLEEGVRIRTGCTVESLLIRDRRVHGVLLAGGERLLSDVVVSNVDPMHLYANMIEPEAQPFSTRIKRNLSRLSMGLYVLYFGTTRQYPRVAHHTIWLGRRYRALLDDIFKRGTLAEDFSLYVHRPTATDPAFAPPGCDSFYVLAPVPNLRRGPRVPAMDWDAQGALLRERIIDALDASLLPDLRKHITADFFMTPQDFADDYLSVAGAGFSIAPHFTQSAWFRFHNKAEGLSGLYLTGAGTHTGAGMPSVLC
ncbi:MAG: phytoene desaturase [Gammaproteobacteria bacterium]|nr:phytoene desaturase [Gammaproteobacteria bacterium]